MLRQLRKARERQQITQQQFSKQLALGQGHLSRIEAGDVDPLLSTFLSMVKALNLNVSLTPRQGTGRGPRPRSGKNGK